MTLTAGQLLLYAGALAVLFLTPGPVWMATIARGLSGGFRMAWPLALGVALGDALWSLLAILGVSWVVSVYGGFLVALRWLASVVFVALGVLIIRHADRPIRADGRLTRPGMWAGFAAGVAVILGNPKAVFFYMGVLPGFFDLSALGRADIAAIVALSMAVPLVGNLFFALFVGAIRGVLRSQTALRQLNLGAGGMLILVGLAIALF